MFTCFVTCSLQRMALHSLNMSSLCTFLLFLVEQTVIRWRSLFFINHHRSFFVNRVNHLFASVSIAVVGVHMNSSSWFTLVSVLRFPVQHILTLQIRLSSLFLFGISQPIFVHYWRHSSKQEWQNK